VVARRTKLDPHETVERPVRGDVLHRMIDRDAYRWNDRDGVLDLAFYRVGT